MTAWCKIEVFLPEEALDRVMEAMAEAGAGEIGEYDHCFAYTPVIGTFRPTPGARPYIGRPGTIEKVREYKLEVNCHGDHIARAVAAARQAHPYEEPVINIITLQKEDSDIRG